MAHTIETRLIDPGRVDCHIVINGEAIGLRQSFSDAETIRYWLSQGGLEGILEACKPPEPRGDRKRVRGKAARQ